MPEKIVIPHPKNDWVSMNVTVRGTAPLIVQRMHPIIVQNMCAKEFGEKPVKELRNADVEYERCFHLLDETKGIDDPDNHGFPVSGFYQGMLFASKVLDIAKTDIKRHIRLEGYLIPLVFEKLERRQDMVKRKGINKAPDIRTRPCYYGWQCVLTVNYNAAVISQTSVLNLLNYAGISSGLGAWRPSSPNCPGPFGTYEVVS